MAKDKPVQKVLQDLVYDSYFMATVVLEQEETTVAQSIMFLSTSTQEPGANRFLSASLYIEKILVNDDFEFNLPEFKSGGPPEVEIPQEVSMIDFKFVTSSSNLSIAIDLQFSVNDKPVHTQRVCQPNTLSPDCCPEI